ncbi:hypothetical protein [Pedobacter gandavensis]|uniref:hypothetical protein n=1 Tax=Pedobacter gandavensis TaxID=2679963 RepID=UPI00292F0B34|nr:hypothetical protein [Pedobacter gandavensis]
MLKRSKTILPFLLCGLFFINVNARDTTKVQSATGSAVPAVQDSLKRDTTKQISDTATVVESKTVPVVPAEKPAVKKNKSSFFDKKAYLQYGVFFLSGAVLVLLIWLIKQQRNKKRNRKMNNTPSEDKHLNNIIIESSALVAKLSADISVYKDRLKAAEIQMAKLEVELADLKESVSVPTGIKHNADPFEEQESTLVKEPHATSYLYFPSPLSDGSFRKVDGKTSFLEGASIYRFKLTSDTDALFEFCEDSSSISMALHNRNDLILSVAEEMEGKYAGAKKVMIYKGKMGRVQLVDNKWLLVQKAQIKYV